MATKRHVPTEHNVTDALTQPLVVPGRFRRDLAARRSVVLELPDFLLYALDARVSEANAGEPPEDRVTLNDYIEAELVNLITLRDVAELDLSAPGFAEAVQSWLSNMR